MNIILGWVLPALLLVLLVCFVVKFRIGVAAAVGNLSKIPGGLVADNVGMWGLLGLAVNIDAALGYGFASVATGTTTANTITGAQIVAGILNRTGSAGSGVTDTTDTALNILAALPNTIPQDGSFQFPIRILNGTGQTITWTAGTGVTVNGTATIANGSWRDFLITCKPNQATPASGTVEFTNMGGGTV